MSLTLFCDEMTDRIFAAYLGAAIGDAWGLPIEEWHAKKVKKVHGRLDRLLPPRPEWIGPGGPLHPEAGAISDDTAIRDDVTQFVLAHPREEQRTPEAFAEYLLWHMTLERWWHPPVDLMVKIHQGRLRAEEAGDAEPIGGRVGSWTALGMIWAGRPDRAAAEVRRLGRVYKSALERELAGAVQAGAAVAVSAGATVDGVIAAMLAASGGRGKALLGRAVEVARRRRGDLDGFVDEVYERLLIDWEPGFMMLRDTEGPLPAPSRAPDDIDARTTSAVFAEQVPLALAAFVFAEGRFVPSLQAGAALGRDNDSILTSTATWAGGLAGMAGIPRDLVDAVIRVNRSEIDFLNTAWRLAEMARENGPAAGESPAPRDRTG